MKQVRLPTASAKAPSKAPKLMRMITGTAAVQRNTDKFVSYTNANKEGSGIDVNRARFHFYVGAGTDSFICFFATAFSHCLFFNWERNEPLGVTGSYYIRRHNYFSL